MTTKVIDLVCGMEIDAKTAPAQSTIQGKTYYFCSQECKNKFDMEPHKYINQVRQPEHHS